jgi:hypothetical protein
VTRVEELVNRLRRRRLDRLNASLKKAAALAFEQTETQVALDVPGVVTDGDIAARLPHIMCLGIEESRRKGSF